MPQNKTFRILPKADEDLGNIHAYSCREFGSDRADQYIKDLDTAFHRLAHEPSLGRDYSHVRPGLMAYRVVSHLVFFKLSVYGVTIFRVLHKSMDYKQHL